MPALRKAWAQYGCNMHLWRLASQSECETHSAASRLLAAGQLQLCMPSGSLRLRPPHLHFQWLLAQVCVCFGGAGCSAPNAAVAAAPLAEREGPG